MLRLMVDCERLGGGEDGSCMFNLRFGRWLGSEFFGR